MFATYGDAEIREQLNRLSDPTLGLKYWHLGGEEAYNPVLQLGGAVTGCKHSVTVESCDGISIHL